MSNSLLISVLTFEVRCFWLASSASTCSLSFSLCATSFCPTAGLCSSKIEERKKSKRNRRWTQRRLMLLTNAAAHVLPSATTADSSGASILGTAVSNSFYAEFFRTGCLSSQSFACLMLCCCCFHLQSLQGNTTPRALLLAYVVLKITRMQQPN